MQDPPKSFTGWFDGIGVLPKVWFTVGLVLFAMFFGW